MILLAASTALADPVLRTELRSGLLRADVRHAASGDPVTDENPAAAGEVVTAMASQSGDGVSVLVDGQEVAAVALDEEQVQFTVPDNAAGGFVELAVIDAEGSSNVATFPVRAADGPGLIASEVDALVRGAALAMDDSRMAIAVTDRMGRPLAIFRKPQATDAAVETALSLARTGAFFSNSQAPLSSRTVRTLSREHFPNDIPNQPAAALFGIEQTNRGCDLNVRFDPGKDVPPAKNFANSGPGPGVAVIPGGVPVFKNGVLAGGIGVAGIDSSPAEFAAVKAVIGVSSVSLLPSLFPPPFAVYIDGIRLPFVEADPRRQPPGTVPAGTLQGEYISGPRDGGSAPEGNLVSPRPSATLTADEVSGILQRSIERANRTRAVIRLPLGSRVRMAIAVTDLDGNLLGLHRMPDSTVFSIDVAVAKARNVVYFSDRGIAPQDLPGVPPGTAVTNRTIGFGAQPFFPSGIDGTPPGPFRELLEFDRTHPCTQGRQPKNNNQSGIVFFPGSAPLYKDGRLVGGLGVSGDGVEQDDYVTAAGAQGFEAPAGIRADQVFLRGVRLPYWKFPRNPEQ